MTEKNMFINNDYDQNHPRVIRICETSVDKELLVTEIGYCRTPASRVHMTQRDTFIIHYIIGGRGKFMDKDFDNGYGFLIAPGEFEKFIADASDPHETCWIKFKGERAHEYVERCELPLHNDIFPFLHNEQCGEIIKQAIFAEEPAGRLAEELLMKSVFYKLMSIHAACVNEIMTKEKRLAHEVAGFIKNNYSENIKIENIADTFHYDRSYIFLLFKKEYGISPQQYLINRRIEMAKHLLIQKDESHTVKEIAYATGFSDPLYFSRLFKKSTGFSPLAFRENCNK